MVQEPKKGGRRTKPRADRRGNATTAGAQLAETVMLRPGDGILDRLAGLDVFIAP